MPNTTMHNIAIIVDDGIVQDDLWQRWIASGRIEQAVMALLSLMGANALMTAPVCIRFASDANVQQLNARWRNKDAVTDVLSFPMQDAPDVVASQPLGDIVLAMPFIHHAAASLQLPANDHTIHLIIHGMLHLLGYDHQDDAAATIMQALETQCMQQLGLHNPYHV